MSSAGLPDGGQKMEGTEMSDCRERLEPLIRRGLVTVDPADAAECCGLPRDEDGFCTYREGHPVYVELPE